MNSALASARRISTYLVEVVGVALYAGVMFAINSQVFMRYVANRPVRWSEELPVVLLTFAVLITLSFRIRDDDHVVFDLVFNMLPEKARAVVTIVSQLAVCGVFAIATPAILDFAHYMRSLSTPILRLPYNFIYYFFVLLVATISVRSALAAFTAGRTLLRGGRTAG